MAKALNSAVRAAIASGQLATARLVDLSTSPTALHIWDWPGEITHESVTYQSLYGQMTLPDEIKTSLGLQSEPFEIIFDGSRARDDDHPVGVFMSSTWHLQPMLYRQIVFDPGTLEIVDVVDVTRGWMEDRHHLSAKDQAEQIKLTCLTTRFRVRGRNHHQRTDQDQRGRLSSDRFFEHTAAKIAIPPVWGKKPASIPGRGLSGAGAAGAITGGRS